MREIQIRHAQPAYACILIITSVLVVLMPSVVMAQAGNSADTDQMLPFLLQMVEDDPSRSDSWRLIGRIHGEHGRTDQAIQAFTQAIETQPDNIAAHADFGRLLHQSGQAEAAQHHFEKVMELGPRSSYAAELAAEGLWNTSTDDLPAPRKTVASPSLALLYAEAAGGNGAISQAGYEIQTFDGADDLEQRLLELGDATPAAQKDLKIFLETGALYNTNLSLTPISREPTAGTGAAMQMFVAPSVDWVLLRKDSWRIGPMARGYFTLNDKDFQSLNLASFQPGAFVERDFASWAGNDVIGRMEYSYAIDFLGQNRFGARHSWTASLTTILPDFDVIYGYITTSLSDYQNDGVTPTTDSLDGLAVTAGISRFFRTEQSHLPTWSLGADVERADTRGANYRYSALTLYSDATIQLTKSLSFVPRVGVGYRNYADFTGPVSRDELTGRASARLRWNFSETASVSAVVGYDRFASKNELFDISRTEAGIVFTYMR